MSTDVVLSRLQSLELQLAVLRAELKQSGPAAPAKTAADLYGLCAGQSETSEEDLEAVKYRLKWDEAESEAGPA